MLRRHNHQAAEVSATDAINLLKDGNERFVNGLMQKISLIDKVEATRLEQHPFAVILSCIDSRVPVEILFDQGIGDVFSVRIAGNVISDDVLGSLEFAVAASSAKIIMVMGHTNCGAVKGACDHVEMGKLSLLLQKIDPAIQAERSVTGNRNSENTAFVNKVTNINVYHAINEMLQRSDIIREYFEANKIKILAAMYFVDSGKVKMKELEKGVSIKERFYSFFDD